MTKKKLTAKQQQFVAEYLIDMNATGAAIRAGYAVSTANARAYAWVGESRNDCPKNMRHLWKVVKEAMKARADKIEIDADWVLQRSVDLFKASVKAKDRPSTKGALELVGKNIGVLAFENRHRIAVDAHIDHDHRIELGKLSKEKRDKLRLFLEQEIEDAEIVELKAIACD